MKSAFQNERIVQFLHIGTTFDHISDSAFPLSTVSISPSPRTKPSGGNSLPSLPVKTSGYRSIKRLFRTDGFRSRSVRKCDSDFRRVDSFHSDAKPLQWSARNFSRNLCFVSWWSLRSQAAIGGLSACETKPSVFQSTSFQPVRSGGKAQAGRVTVPGKKSGETSSRGGTCESLRSFSSRTTPGPRSLSPLLSLQLTN